MIKLCVKLDDVDYNGLIDRFLPIFLEKAAKSGDSKLKMLSSLPQGVAAGMLKSLSDDKKEELALSLIRMNGEKIAALLTDEGSRRGINFKITEITAEKTIG